MSAYVTSLDPTMRKGFYFMWNRLHNPLNFCFNARCPPGMAEKCRLHPPLNFCCNARCPCKWRRGGRTITGSWAQTLRSHLYRLKPYVITGYGLYETVRAYLRLGFSILVISCLPNRQSESFIIQTVPSKLPSILKLLSVFHTLHIALQNYW